MAFIELVDFPASIHDDILNALVKDIGKSITDNVDRTIDEMAAYLNGRYDTVAIFSATGDSRNKYMLRLALTITIYYIYLIHNPRKMTQTIKDEFERAIETLEGIRDGNINPVGLPVPETEVVDNDESNGDGSSMQWGSDIQLGTNW